MQFKLPIQLPFILLTAAIVLPLAAILAVVVSQNTLILKNQVMQPVVVTQQVLPTPESTMVTEATPSATPKSKKVTGRPVVSSPVPGSEQ